MVSAPTIAPNPKLDELVATMHKLRAPGGCVWDRDQSHASLVQYLVEETYELIEAIESGGREELIEELGDVLYQVIFHADIEAEAGGFTLEDVAAHMTAKMIARHPHVFGDVVAETPDDVVATWDRVKALEKAHRSSTLDGIPMAMPALALADKLLGRAGKLGVGREFAPIPATEVELGEQLLGMVAAARVAGLDSERALRGALRALQDDVRAAESAP
ncbi:MAG: MazG family protein [Pseudolysinimonas sp.]